MIARSASLVAVSLLAILVMLPMTAQQTASVTSVREADASCAGCHKQIFDSYTKTVMANASGPAIEVTKPATFHHKASGVDYVLSVEKNDVFLTFYRPGEFIDGGVHGQRKLDYYIGSGHRGRTYLYNVDGYWFEAPINWYTAYGGYDMRPGTQTNIFAPFDLPVASRCLHCHTSGVQQELPGTRNRFATAPFTHTGITCERCHGDSTAHVRTRGKASLVNPAKLEPARRDAVCQQCHLEGEILIDRAGKKLAEFKPGDRLTDYAAYFMHEGAPKAGFGPVTQVEALPLSKCKRVSGDKMTCTSCHDLHRMIPQAEKVSFYRGKCLQCHSAPEFAAKHHPENQDCAACHMPRNQATDIPHQQTTDHRIPRIPPPITAPGVPGRQLVSILSAEADDRDLGLAYEKLAESGNEFATEQGVRLLKSAMAKHPDDSALLAGLGYLLKKQRKDQEAIAVLKKALEIDPRNSWAAANLGVLYKTNGQPEKAIALWEEVFTRTPFYAGLNLAALHCEFGHRARAVEVLNRMREFDPDSDAIRRQLAEARYCQEKK